MSESIFIFIVLVVASGIGYVIGKLNSKKEIEDRSLIPVVIGDIPVPQESVHSIAIHKSEMMVLLKNGRSVMFALQLVEFLGYRNPYEWVKKYGAKILGNGILVNLSKEAK